MDNTYLMHYGVMGMKWGVRRYQNADGTLTALGKSHYGVSVRDPKTDRERYISNIVADSGERETAKKTAKATAIGTFIAGPLVGAAAGIISYKKNKKKAREETARIQNYLMENVSAKNKYKAKEFREEINKDIIDWYREEHPKSKASDTEIMMYYLDDIWDK